MSARSKAEDRRVAKLKAKAAVPERHGPEIPDAPARGGYVAIEPMSLFPDGAEDWQVKHGGHLGRDPLRARDVFDLIAEQSARASRRAGQPEPFTPRQVDTARRYRALVEREAGSGIKIASLETTTGGGGGGEDPIDRAIRQRRALTRMRKLLDAGGWALAPQRAAPHGDRRRAIRLRVAVDMLCLQEMTLSAILTRFGWSRGAKTENRLRAAIQGALDRMDG